MKKDDTVFLKHILDAIMSVSCKAGLRTSPYMRSKITSMKIVLRKLSERVRVDSQVEGVEEVGK